MASMKTLQSFKNDVKDTRVKDIEDIHTRGRLNKKETMTTTVITQSSHQLPGLELHTIM